jgi:hypothetical protein
MLKPLTLSLSLAVALFATSVSKAGHNNTYASGQCAAPSSQCAAPSAQCGEVCAPKKKCCLTEMCNRMKKACTPKPRCYTYTWVLKKKRVWGCHKGGNACGSPTCETCGVYPSGQGYAAPSGQGYAAPAGQMGYSGAAYGAPAYGAGTASLTPAPIGAPAPAIATVPTGDEAPPAPEVPSTGPQSSLLFSTTPSGN